MIVQLSQLFLFFSLVQKCYYGRMAKAKLKNMPLKSVKKHNAENYPLLGLNWFEF